MHLPLGFRFAGVACGIKKTAGRKDLTLVVADRPATVAGVYTQNRVVAAPVLLSRARTPSAACRAVVINSGNANACTGPAGMDNARAMTQRVAAACAAEGITEDSVLVMSTGIIGVPLPMEKVHAGIDAAADALACDEEAFLRAADGILTTDNGRKLASQRIALAGGHAHIAAMAKGAGMIGPNMATLLGLVMTDAALEPADAQAILAEAVDASFNSISVEGHTSTNDTVLLLASGHGGAAPLAGEDRERFAAAVRETCIALAKQIPADGEGASHLVEIQVAGADTLADARRIARTIADSALVKTAIAGNDPNWGRIVSAAGYAGIAFAPERLRLEIQGHLLFDAGGPVAFDEAAVSAAMGAEKTVVLKLTVGEGAGHTTFWTSDLTEAYVRFNSQYTT